MFLYHHVTARSLLTASSDSLLFLLMVKFTFTNLQQAGAAVVCNYIYRMYWLRFLEYVMIPDELMLKMI